MEISLSSNSITGGHIATQFGTCHDSPAVVPCAKFCSDHFISFWMRAKWNFHHIWIVMEKLLVKWAPGLLNHFWRKKLQSTTDRLWPFSLRWRHNDHAGVWNHQPHGCLLNRLFRRKSKKTSKLRVTGLCAGNSPGTGEFPAQMASYAENVSIWWRHHVLTWFNFNPSMDKWSHTQ